MVIIRETPDHVLDERVINKLKKVNSTAVVDVLARNGYDPRYVYMPNVVTMNPGLRLVARAVTVRFLPARPDNTAEKPGGNESPEFAAFELAGPGDVIVMESMRNKIMSIGGDIKFLRLKQRGIDGLICDGPGFRSFPPRLPGCRSTRVPSDSSSEARNLQSIE